MNFQNSDAAHTRKIDLAAAEWLVKRDRGLTPEEQDDFSQWLATDPRHGAWLARHQQTWKEFNLLGEWRPEHSLEPNPDLLARPRAVRRWLAPVALAAAACIALVFVGQRWRPEPGKTAAQDSTEIAVTPAYTKRILEDGSVVELNRGAAVDVRYTATERHIYLASGEAYFTVAKNPARPFYVHGGPIAVRAVGTAFNVRLESDKMEVLVTEGRVEVKPSGTAAADQDGTPVANQIPLLIAGQLAVVLLDPKAEAPQVTAVAPQDMARLLAWQPQMLDFSSTPLSSVVAEFNRRNRTQIVLADSTLGDLPIVASFRSDSIDAFVRLLEVTAGVRAERRGDNTIVLHAAPGAR